MNNNSKMCFHFTEIIPVLLNNNHSKMNPLIFTYDIKWKDISDKDAALSSSAIRHTSMETYPMPHSSHEGNVERAHKRERMELSVCKTHQNSNSRLGKFALPDLYVNIKLTQVLTITSPWHNCGLNSSLNREILLYCISSKNAQVFFTFEHLSSLMSVAV